MLEPSRDDFNATGAAEDRRPMRLGYLVPEFPGQTHIFFWREIAELKQMGVDVHLLSTRRPDASIISHSWSEEAMSDTRYLVQLGLMDALMAFAKLPVIARKEVRDAAFAHGFSSFKDILLCVALGVKLLRECAASGIDHVHVHSCGRAALIAAMANRIGGLNYSITLHGPLQDYGSLQAFKWRYAQFATIITEKLKAEVLDELAGNLPRRLIVQSMGVDIDRLSRSAPYEPYSAPGPVKIFCCGRLHVVKGHQVLIDAAAQLKQRGVEVEIKIAGQDENQGEGYKRVLDEQIERLGLADQVCLLGAIDELEVKQNILDAHMFVLASMHEPLGVAYMEAMSCEVPTIGTDAGGVRELIDNGEDGILVPPNDADALANAIQAVAEDSDRALELGKKGRAKIVSKFSSAAGAAALKEAIFGTWDR